MKALTPAQRQFLKGLAHTRQPVVMIGNQGLTAAVFEGSRSRTGCARTGQDQGRQQRIGRCAALAGGNLRRHRRSASAANRKVLVIYRAAAKPVIVLPG